ncbi:AraC family transcriptional regulator [Cohnella sp. REN36]|uniref:AraC family transcriptional regulator n=1 Tax=Cohnella sp. REN36 TaxID=2887347 RepID=UPI001D154516|nr:AraC family transcriptional regulator [Cohnella sp. REN36]MCC3371974.1 AraC family transcriptional regulator [Cohnella sp. REN36]
MMNKMIMRKTYLRVFVTSAILITVIVSAFSLYLVQRFSQSARDEVLSTIQNQLKQVQKSAEFTLYKLRLYGMRMFADELVREWFSSPNDPQLLVRLSNSMKEYAASEPFIQNIYLISARENRVWTLRESMFDNKDFFDQALLQKVRNDRSPYFRFHGHSDGKRSYIYLAIRDNSMKNSDGYLVMMVDKSDFDQNVLQSEIYSQMQLIVTDDAGNFILGNDNEPLLTAIKKFGAMPDSRFDWKVDGRKWFVHTAQIEPEGWYVYQFTPWDVWQFKLNELRNAILLSAGVMLTLTLFFLFWVSRRHYMPFSELIGLVQRNGTEPDGRGRLQPEHQILRSGIGKLVTQVEQMNQSVKSNQQMIREDMLRLWIRNGTLPAVSRESLIELTKVANAKQLGLAVVRIEYYPSFEEKYNYYSRKLLKYAMGNIAQETLRYHDADCETVDFDDDHIVLFWANTMSEDAIHRMLTEVKENINRCLNMATVCSYHLTHEQDFNLQSVYRQALEFSMLKFLNGEDKIYDERDWSRFQSQNLEPFSDKLVQQLLQSVGKGEEHEAFLVMEQLFARLPHLPFEECRFQLIRLVYEMKKIFLRAGTLQDFEGVSRQLDRFANLNEVYTWLKKEIVVFKERNQKPNRETRKEDVVASVVDYVNQHLQEAVLTIEEIAEHIGLSPNYVRTIFKDILQISLSEFILGLRIEKAKKLLHSTEWPITQIMDSSGFQTKSHFFTVFKKATGKTPMQYRFEADDHRM